MNDTNLTYHLPLLFDELVKNGAIKKKTIIGANRNANGTTVREWQANRLTNANMLHARWTRGFKKRTIKLV